MGDKIRRVSQNYHYILVKPGRNGNLHEAAMRLAELDSVKEVAVTEGEYGFVVRSKHAHGQDNAKLGRMIARAVGGTSRSVLCHCRYSKP